MYSKAEASKIKADFWTRFGKYMQPVESSFPMKVNWINYKTGVKHIRIISDFTNSAAYTKIVLSFPDEDIRKGILQHFELLLSELSGGDEADWLITDYRIYNDKPISEIVSTLDGVNIFKHDTWPAAIAFLKSRLIAFDRFWFSHKDIFDYLV